MNYIPDYVTFESMGGTVKKVRRLITPELKTWSAFNPSVGLAPDGSMVMAIRSSNYILNTATGQYELTCGNSVTNETWLCDLTEELEITNLRKISYGEIEHQGTKVKLFRGAEDAKLFWRDGWKFTAVLKEPNSGIPIPRVGVFALDNDHAELLSVGGFDGELPEVAEKNWMTTYDENPNFDFVYNESSIIKNRERNNLRDSNDVIKDLRGGSNLWDLGDGTYLALTHKTYVKWIEFYDSKSFGIKKSHIRDYAHYFARYDCNGILFEMSTPFRFVGRGVEFGAGLVVKNGDVIVSFGKDDASSYVGKITLKAVLENLKET